MSSAGCGAEPSGQQLEEEAGDLAGLSVVEVTTVTTVQSSVGVFLSPRPQQLRPDYVESGGSASAASAEPSLEDDRAKVDTALLFRASTAQRFGFEASLPGIDAQHFFPTVEGQRWPIELVATTSAATAELWSEWEGWRAYAGLSVRGAAAATLDYEQLGRKSPLVVSMAADSMAGQPIEAQTLIVTNRSDQPIARALLVYSHAGGIGVRAVSSLSPGSSEMTAAGPKEAPPDQLLDEARSTLDTFFSDELGPELGSAVARAKSIPFLETHGLRLIYLLSDAHAPATVGLPAQVGERRRVSIAQAEVLPSTEESHVLTLLAGDELRASDVATALGRFARAKLEVAELRGNATVRAEAARLLGELSE